ncbi:helix-turn-helix transcriptional regulator [Pseudomaricurvus alkylphenolicus]|uniref:helix-turn-helix domain-containing protein n=1 Tax=Pseudomaricurvus alkylphenolicus TaxID=1306991 RepID=UPI00141DB1C6|nr:helix-turn-helix transcriptional regulator [Pseudomaricurvus alkylphenolicus]NIB44984.1 helix-turn-helix transcriptional regulator [Pseudomaricurvus alkylphenolicus]
MPSSSDQNPKDDLPFARLLRFWRDTYQLSQEQLAEALGSSTRHINRLENGHVHPSKDIVGKIAKQFSLRERDSNYLLLSAGYRPASSKLDFNSPTLKWLRKAVTLSLKALNPYPSILLDGAFNIVMVNKAWVGLFQSTVEPAELQNIKNYIDFFYAHIVTSIDDEECSDAQSLMAMWLQQEVILDNDDENRQRLNNLLSQPQIPKNWKQRAAALDPMSSFRIKLNVNGNDVHFYHVVQTIGAIGPAAYVSEPRLSIHTYYPVDDQDVSSLTAGDLQHPLLHD